MQRCNKSNLEVHQALEKPYHFRKCPTWTCGREIFSIRPPGLAQSAGSSFCFGCLGLVLSCHRVSAGLDDFGCSAPSQLYYLPLRASWWVASRKQFFRVSFCGRTGKSKKNTRIYPPAKGLLAVPAVF